METPIGIGAGRRKTLQAIEKKNPLPPIENPARIEVVVGAVQEISLTGVRSPPRDTVDRIKEAYNALPDEAQPEYIRDALLLRRINAARRQFNDWMEKRRRMAEIASPMEAGRSKYPTKRSQKLSRLERQASDDLDERMRRITSAAGGARQRALNAVGSSIAEQTAKHREQRRQELRERLDEGSIVQFRNPQLRVGQVVRINRVSVRVRHPNPRTGASCPVSGDAEPEMVEDRIQLHSEYLEPLDAESVEDGREAIGLQHEHR
ncbi:hypothetical protein ACH9L7_20000 (plasmid) [Haloferax sp. S1W]|uniref:hypothetical protein n=1 Tax=Haloferax sp. S1W TaxID=3377110 RepID=UPI0037C7BC2D